jgi:hypothetical protein
MNRVERRGAIGGRALVIAALFLGGGLVAEPRAYAQQPEVTGNLAQSRALFDEGRQLLKTGNYAEACSKFEASDRLDSGVGTRFNLADCREKQGKTATAWALFLDIAAETKLQGDRRREAAARRRVSELEPRLARLILRVASAPTQIEVRLDGQAVEPAAFNVAVPVDPGEHVITAVAQGRVGFRQVLSVEGEGKQALLEIPPLAPVMLRASFGAAPTLAGDPPRAAAVPSNQHLGIVYGALAVSAAGMGTGAYFAVRTASKRSALSEICPTGMGCSAAELGSYASSRSEATASRTVSLVGFTVGALAATTAAVAYFTGRRSVEPNAISFRPTAEPSLVGANLTYIW